MADIRFVERQDQLAWLVDSTWESFRINAEDQKRDIFVWLEQHTTGRVVISAEGKMPQRGDMGWIPILYGDQKHYRIYFEDPDSAMLFKLTWA